MSAVPNNMKIAPRAPRGGRTLQERADEAQQRLRLETINRQRKLLALGDYSGAKRSRLRQGSSPKSTSADAQLDSMTAERLRAESQRMMRNAPLVRGMVRRLVDRAIGEGMRLQCTTANKEWNRAAEAAWKNWSERYADVRGLMDFGAMQRAMLRAMIVDGDVAMLKTEGLGEGPEDVLRLQAIEAQRIGGSRGGPASSGTGKAAVVSGIECDASGRPRAYWVSDYVRSGTGVERKPRRIDAADVVYLVAPDRFSQTRGEPRLSSLIGLNEGMNDYIHATIVAAKVGASQALIVKSASPAATQGAMLGDDVTGTDPVSGQQQTERWERIEPGSVRYIGMGESTESFKPEQPTTAFDAFIRMLVRIAGADMDMPLELVLLDHSQSSAYAGRAALAAVKGAVTVLRNVLVRRVLSEVHRQVIGGLIAAGTLAMNEEWEKHSWIPPADPSFEPDRETAAAVQAIANNLTTKRAVVESTGQDLDEVMEERRREVEQERAMGISPPGVPGAKPSGGASSGASEPSGGEPVKDDAAGVKEDPAGADESDGGAAKEGVSDA